MKIIIFNCCSYFLYARIVLRSFSQIEVHKKLALQQFEQIEINDIKTLKEVTANLREQRPQGPA